MTLFTIGYGNRSLAQLVQYLRDNNISVLVDIRSHPMSRHNPEFDQDSLREVLQGYDIVYHWAGRHLGGLRGASSGSLHLALPESLRGFADHMQSLTFERAVNQLITLAGRHTTAIMCAEEDPGRCHRRLIADYFLLKGYEVKHLRAYVQTHSHAFSVEARRESAQLIYDRMVTGELKF